MKIEKIKNRMTLEEVELQGCSNDCTEYFSKGAAEIAVEKQQGLKGTSADTVEQIKEFKNTFGYYCWMQNTPKTIIYW